MNMNKRSRVILSTLIQKKEYGQAAYMKELAEQFKVSTRTIRNDLEQINEFLNKNKLSGVSLGKQGVIETGKDLSLIHISEHTRPEPIEYDVF